jgi:hypothetical protein
MAKVGRPTDYTPELALKICERIADGESLRKICADSDMPARSAVFRWLGQHPEFEDHYARAREMSAEADADDVGHYARQAAEGKIDPAAARAAIDGLKWSAGKRKPKKYGDAVQMRHSGAIGRFDASRYTDEQLEQLESLLGDLAVTGGDAGGGEGGEGASGG